MISTYANVRRGFTLIELLVVIAAIAVLSAIVLASLSSARVKGADAGIKKELTEARSHAEVYYLANTNSYGSICSPGVTAPDGTRGIYEMVYYAAQQAGLSSVNTALNTQGTMTTATCRACAPGSCTATYTNSWAAEVPLRAGGMFCVDSRGFGGVYTGAASRLAAGDTDCSS